MMKIQRERGINFDENIQREKERDINFDANIHRDREREREDINFDQIYRERARERDIISDEYIYIYVCVMTSLQLFTPKLPFLSLRGSPESVVGRLANWLLCSLRRSDRSWNLDVMTAECYSLGLRPCA